MIKTYLFTAMRSLWKNKGFTALNMLGMAIGISAALVIYLLVTFDFSYEKGVPDHQRIYRVVSNFTSIDDKMYNRGVNAPLANGVAANIAGIEAAAPFRELNDLLKVTVDPNSEQRRSFRNQEKFFYANPEFFKILQYKWLLGAPENALSAPNQVVLTSKTAGIYFPNVPVDQLAGKTLHFDDSITVTISGVVADPEFNTEFRFKGFVSYSTIAGTKLQPNDWLLWDNTTSSQQLLVKLPKGANPHLIEQSITSFYRRNHPKEPNSTDDQYYTLQPLTDIHFNADYGNFDERLAHKPTLYGLLVIAGFLLLLGCINFINLTTAQSSKRAKEIGIRKTMGSSKKQLVWQFMSETLLLTLMATVLSIILAPVLLKVFADFIPPEVRFPGENAWRTFGFLAIVVLVVGFLSGIYPALVLSGYKPIQVLKNYSPSGNAHTRKATLRKTLTISQFVVAQVFIAATMLVGKQVKFTLSKDIGVRKDAIVFVRTPFARKENHNRKLFLSRVAAIPEVAMASMGGNPPNSQGMWTSTINYKDGGKNDLEINAEIKVGDTNYIRLYDLKLAAGRGLRASDTLSELLINESYAQMLGFKNPEDAVGVNMMWDDKYLPVAGVLKNFNSKSLHSGIRPLVLRNDAINQSIIHILLRPQNASGTSWATALKKVETIFKELFTEMDYRATFFDESLARAYDTEQKASKLLLWTAGLAVLISCLGLLGLVTFTTTQRTKEIGVRKVLGASVSQIVTLLSKDILVLVAVALIIAIPISWMGLHHWLQQFAYRTSISWWVFAATGGLMLLVALLTLSIQTVRAALVDPVKSLRSE